MLGKPINPLRKPLPEFVVVAAGILLIWLSYAYERPAFHSLGPGIDFGELQDAIFNCLGRLATIPIFLWGIAGREAASRRRAFIYFTLAAILAAMAFTNQVTQPEQSATEIYSPDGNHELFPTDPSEFFIGYCEAAFCAVVGIVNLALSKQTPQSLPARCARPGNK